MREPITGTFATLDGVMQASGGPGEDLTGGFKYGGWSVNYWDDMMAKIMTMQRFCCIASMGKVNSAMNYFLLSLPIVLIK